MIAETAGYKPNSMGGAQSQSADHLQSDRAFEDYNILPVSEPTNRQIALPFSTAL